MTHALRGWVKTGYAVAETGITAAEFFLQVYLLKFYVDSVGLSPTSAGLAIALAMVWDAVTDPLMGAVSDRTRLRGGRRRPYFLVGGLALAAALVFLFTPPTALSSTGSFLWLLGGTVLLNTAMTLIAVPHCALAADMAPQPSARNDLFGRRFVFANVGLISAVVVPGLVAAEVAEPRAAVRLTVMVIGLLVVVTAVVTWRATRGYDQPAAGSRGKSLHVRGLVAPLRNPGFLILLGAYLLGSMGRTLNSAVALFYYQYRLLLSEQTVFLAVLLPFTALLAMSVVVWIQIADRLGKKRPAMAGILFLGLSTMVVYPVFPAGTAWPPALYGMTAGLMIGAVFLLDAMVSDAADWDRLRRGHNAVGLYFGYQRLFAKLARALGLALSGFLLEQIGFEQGAAVQSQATQNGLALIFGPVVGACFVAAALVLCAWPFDAAKEQRISRLRQKRDEANGCTKQIEGNGDTHMKQLGTLT